MHKITSITFQNGRVISLTPQQVDKFLTYRKRTEDGCLTWTRGVNDWGYGLWCITCAPNQQATVLAHRLSWTIENGPIPDLMTVDHEQCFRPACQDVSHMQLLSNTENARRQRSSLAPACSAGHPWTPESTVMRAVHDRPHPRRVCAICHPRTVSNV